MVGGLDDGDDTGGGHLARREGPAGHGAGEALQGLVLGSQGVELQLHAGVLAGQLVHLALQLHLLSLQLLLLGDAFDAAAGGVAAVLQGPPPLLQLGDVILGQPAQVQVELPHGHGHQLVVADHRGILTQLLLDLQHVSNGVRNGGRVWMLATVTFLPFLSLTFKSLLVLKLVVIPCMQTTGQNLTEDTLRSGKKKS